MGAPLLREKDRTRLVSAIEDSEMCKGDDPANTKQADDL